MRDGFLLLFYLFIVARQWIEHYFEPRVSIRPDRLCFYGLYTGLNKPRTKDIKRVISNDTLTYAARQRLTSAINLLVGTAKQKKLYSADLKKYFNFRINFVTLTLPSLQEHSDSEIHNKIFKSFIRYWLTRNPNLLYVYKAEVQDSGNLHYHLTTNSFIHHKVLRKLWNKACNLLGYIDRCKVDNPNSTDVHATKAVKNIAGYLCSYVSKKDLYQKPLSRYFRRYSKALKAYDGPVFHLPKNYFARFKRKVNIKLWDASKGLLIKPLSLCIQDLNIEEGIQSAEQYFTKIKAYEYVSVAYLNTLKLPANNPLFKAYFEQIKHLVSKSAGATHLLN